MRLRIIAGKYKGLRIKAPAGIRPTQDKIREALFNVIAPFISNARVLDIFAGSGSFGIEALSRGCLSAVFVENSRPSISAVEENIKKIAPKDTAAAKVLPKGAKQALSLLKRNNERFDIIFLDPPYHKNMVKKCLKDTNIYDILAHSGFILAEHSANEDIPDQAGCLVKVRRLKYGHTVISIFKKGEEDDKESGLRGKL